jgi:extracellular factor (EF) 3-hydroxypalmitic acid methyl ester biosynthesis protein
MNTQTLATENIVSRLCRFIQAGGPEETEYDELTHIWDRIKIGEETTLSKVLTGRKLLQLFGDDFLNNTLHGFSYRKPHGYSGDFEIIDHIYQQKLPAEKKFHKWDKYYHVLHAAKAVINRKKYFIELVKRKVSKMNRPLQLLNIASGPCRDVLELLKQVPIQKLKIHCVEMDPKAIEYARNLLGTYANDIEFTRRNIFKFNTCEKFDLIWSAGLFDYFENDVFVRLLSQIHKWCAPSGEIVIGNFSTFNPSRSYMEKALNWYLFHRTHEELKKIAFEAGFNYDQIEVRSEELGVNLFLHAIVE